MNGQKLIIEQRISGCIDFPASEAVYHFKCYQTLH